MVVGDPQRSGPVSPSGSANTRSPNSSPPARSASSVEDAGRLPTSNNSLLDPGRHDHSSARGQIRNGSYHTACDGTRCHTAGSEDAWHDRSRHSPRPRSRSPSSSTIRTRAFRPLLAQSQSACRGFESLLRHHVRAPLSGAFSLVERSTSAIARWIRQALEEHEAQPLAVSADNKLVRVSRAYLAGLGTAGSMVLCAVVLFLVGSAVVAFHGWKPLGIGDGPATQTLEARAAKAHARHARDGATGPVTPATPRSTGASAPGASAVAHAAGRPPRAAGSTGTAPHPRSVADGNRGSRASRVSHHGSAPAPTTTTSTSPTTPTPTTSTPAPTPAATGTATTPAAPTSPVTVTVPIRVSPGIPHPGRPLLGVPHPGHSSHGHGPGHETPVSVVKPVTPVVPVSHPVPGPPFTHPDHPTHPVHPVHPVHSDPSGPEGIPSSQGPTPAPPSGPPFGHPSPGPGHVGGPGHIGAPGPAPAVPGPGGPSGHPGHGLGFGHR